MRDDFIKALRSGQYTQLKGMFHIEGTDSYCAVGLLRYIAKGECIKEFLPKGFRPTALLAWNDYVGLPFQQIADRLERMNNV
jgi:hypothetical protein